MNQNDFENLIMLALLKDVTPRTAAEIQRNFETAVALLLRHITPITASDIENKVTLVAPAFGMDDAHVEQAIQRLGARFLPEYLIP